MSEVKAVLPQANPHWEGYEKHGEGHPAPAHAAAAVAEGAH
jgi:hypothetical protein